MDEKGDSPVVEENGEARLCAEGDSEDGDKLLRGDGVKSKEPEHEVAEKHSALHPAKDKGWAWMCVLSVFFIQVITMGSAKSFGVLFAEFVEKYDADIRAATWVSALHGFVSMAMGPFATCLGVRYTNRKVVVIGGVFVGLGFVLSAFATALPVLYATYGLLFGFGMGLAYGPSIVVLSQYFDRRKALANGLAVAGSGVGSFIIPPMYRFLVDEFGLRGCLLIHGALTLHVCVCGGLLRPFATRNQSPRNGHLALDDKIKQDRECITDENIEELPADNFDETETSAMSQSSEPTSAQFPSSEENKSRCGSCFSNCISCLCFMPSEGSTRGRPLLDLRLLTNPVFHVFFWSVFFATIGQANTYIMLPSYAIECGMTKSQGAILLSTIGASDLLGRVLFGWISDLRLISMKNGFFLTMAITGVVAIFLPLSSAHFSSLMVVCGAFGIFGGAYVALIPVVLSEALGPSKLPNAFGLTIMGQGFCMLLSFPTMGAMRTTFGSWDPSFYFCAAMLLLGSTMVLCRFPNKLPQPLKGSSPA